MHRLLSVFVALGAWQALTVTAQDAADPACMANCASQSRADFTKFECANAEDAPCLCGKEDFTFSVRDCSEPCGVSEAEIDTFLADNFCLGQEAPAQSSDAPEPEATTSDTPDPETTAALEPETTSAPEPTSAPAPETTSEPEPEPETLTDEAETSTSTSAVPLSTTTSSSSQTSDIAGAGATGTADADDADDADDEDDGADKSSGGGGGGGGGLSQSAIIGIGVGAGAAGIAVLGVIAWLLIRNRKKDARQFVEISKPMPNAAGPYSGRSDPFAEKRGDIIEMQTNRYEDMVPRREPRTEV